MLLAIHFLLWLWMPAFAGMTRQRTFNNSRINHAISLYRLFDLRRNIDKLLAVLCVEPEILG